MPIPELFREDCCVQEGPNCVAWWFPAYGGSAWGKRKRKLPTLDARDEINKTRQSFLTYGGCAKGIPKNWETEPEVIPVKVPLSRVTVGAAAAPLTM
jgi:hypothetical protein